MGTTIAAVVVNDCGLTVVNVGDSAVFEFVDGRLVQLSVDDVPPGENNLPGVPSARLTQSLGGRLQVQDVDPHVYEDTHRRERRLVLCTDGLTSFVARSDIAAILDREPDEAVVAALTALALEAGAPGRHAAG